jgi:hypothetical protein
VTYLLSDFSQAFLGVFTGSVVNIGLPTELNMSLKFKRNLPLILFLVALLSFLAFMIGDQQVVSYTVTLSSQQIEQTAMDSSTNNAGVHTVDFSPTQATISNAQIFENDESSNKVSELTNPQ